MSHDTPTLRLPMPGATLAALQRRQQAQSGAGAAGALPHPAARAGHEPRLRPSAAANPVLRAADLLLALVPPLRATATHADPVALRGRMLERIADFEALALAHGVPAHKITAARYLLCSFVDETIAATPWGAHGAWAERNLLQHYHEEREGGDKAFQLLERLGRDAAANADLLELFYVCLALGYEGRMAAAPRSRAQLDAIAQRLHDVLAAQQPALADGGALSARWAGSAARGHRDAAAVPWWALAALAAALWVALWWALNARLEAQAGAVFARIVALPSALGAQGRPAAAAAAPALAPLLHEPIHAGALEVRDEAMRSVITLPSDALFEPGTAQLDPSRASALLAALSRALQAQHARAFELVVIGHTDDAAPNSMQFASNWQLSRSQAQAVADRLLAHGAAGAAQVRAEGRANAEPRDHGRASAQPRTDERARNRRIEIEVQWVRPGVAR